MFSQAKRPTKIYLNKAKYLMKFKLLKYKLLINFKNTLNLEIIKNIV